MPQIYGSSLPNYAAKFATAQTFSNPTAYTGPTYGGKTIADGGVSPAMSAAQRAEDAWKTANDLMLRPGPFTPEVTQQLVNRQADQSAAAEATNADELRNLAAARGIDPTQALRQGQAQRQQSNIAFQGDMASKAAIENFSAESPGRMMAAQANLNRSFGNQTVPAVQGGTAFSTYQPRSSGGYDPGTVHMQAQQQPMAFGPSKLYGAKTTPAPVSATSKPVIPNATTSPPVPQQQVQYGTTAFGPVSTAENARAYQNIYKYTY